MPVANKTPQVSRSGQERNVLECAAPDRSGVCGGRLFSTDIEALRAFYILVLKLLMRLPWPSLHKVIITIIFFPYFASLKPHL